MATTFVDQLIGVPVVLPNFEDWTTVTMTSSWTTNTAISAKRMIMGSLAYYDVQFSLSGAPNAGDLTVILPSGDVIATSSMVGATNLASVIFGSAYIYDAAVRAYVGNVVFQNANQVIVGSGQSGNLGLVNNTNPVTFGSGDIISVKFAVPLTRLAGGMSAYGAGLSLTSPSLVQASSASSPVRTFRQALTITANSNCTVGAFSNGLITRIGNTVRVSAFGQITTGPSLGGASRFLVSLPIASALTNGSDAVGQCLWGLGGPSNSGYSAGYCFWLTAQTVEFYFVNTVINTAANLSFSFEYEIK